MSLETITAIRVDSNGQWWNSSDKLVHEGVLFFFKSNLYRASDGRYYIRSQFGDRTETGWLESIEGFPLFADGALVKPADGTIGLVLDNGLILERKPERIYIGDEDMLWVELQPSEQHPSIGELPIPVRLRPRAMSALGPCLEEEDGQWFLNLDGRRQKLTARQPPFG